MSTATDPATTTRDAPGSWLVAGAATAVLAVVLGVFGSIGVLIDPLAATYGAPRSHLVLLFATALAVHTAAARSAGRAVDRWGPRPALTVAAAGMGTGLLAPATATTAWVAVAGYGIGLGLASACTWVATSTVVSGAFEHRRAAALGLLAAGPAAGGVVIAPAAAALAATGGPRIACAVLAVLGTAVCVAGALLIRDHSGPGTTSRPSLAARTDPRHLGRALGTHATTVGIGGVIGPVLASPRVRKLMRTPPRTNLRRPIRQSLAPGSTAAGMA